MEVRTNVLEKLVQISECFLFVRVADFQGTRDSMEPWTYAANDGSTSGEDELKICGRDGVYSSSSHHPVGKLTIMFLQACRYSLNMYPHWMAMNI